MKKTLRLFIFLITLGFLFFCFSCSYCGARGVTILYFAEEFTTIYTAEEHEFRIGKVFGSLPRVTCEDVKVLYSLQEEPRFYIVHYIKHGTVMEESATGELREVHYGKDEEEYLVGFIYDGRYYMMGWEPDTVKKIFEEYRDKKVYYFYIDKFAYENEEGKKMYIGDNEKFIQKKLGGQREVKEKYYKKLRARAADYSVKKVIDKTWWCKSSKEEKECGLISEDKLPLSSCA